MNRIKKTVDVHKQSGPKIQNEIHFWQRMKAHYFEKEMFTMQRMITIKHLWRCCVNWKHQNICWHLYPVSIFLEQDRWENNKTKKGKKSMAEWELFCFSHPFVGFLGITPCFRMFTRIIWQRNFVEEIPQRKLIKNASIWELLGLIASILVLLIAYFGKILDVPKIV